MKLLKKIILILFLSLSFPNNQNNSPIVILVSFDGFRYDYADMVDTPNFDFLGNNGIKAKSLQPIFPSFTFPNHYSIATGCYADKHGILGNVFYDYNKRSEYSYKNSKDVQNGKWYDCEPVWVTAEKNNIKSGTYFWVGSEAKINGYRPSIYKYYKSGVDPFKKVDEVIKWLKYPDEEKPHLITLYFNEPDHSGHVHGPVDTRTLMQVKLADSILGYLIQSLEELESYNRINLIVVSDHGMVEVDKSRVIDLSDYLGKYKMRGRGPFVELYNHPIGNKRLTALPDYASLMKKFGDYIKIYSKYDMDEEYVGVFPENFHYPFQEQIGFFLLAEPGWMIYDGVDSYKDGLPVKGMHGYDPQYMDMHGIFYAHGPMFNQNMKIDTFELIHIYPLLCEMLNIEPYENIDGKLSVLKHILN